MHCKIKRIPPFAMVIRIMNNILFFLQGLPTSKIFFILVYVMVRSGSDSSSFSLSRLDPNPDSFIKYSDPDSDFCVRSRIFACRQNAEGDTGKHI